MGCKNNYFDCMLGNNLIIPSFSLNMKIDVVNVIKLSDKGFFRRLNTSPTNTTGNDVMSWANAKKQPLNLNDQ